MKQLAVFLLSIIGLSSLYGQNPAMEICPIPISSSIPLCNVYDLNGKQVKLDSICKSQPTVLVFYRGGWCPYCKRQLSALQEIETEIKNYGYQVVALSADHYSTAPRVMDRKNIIYSVYSDFEQKAAKKYGISFVLDEKTYKKYKNAYQLDIEKWGHNDRHELPVPSIFIIKDGRIQFSYVNPEYKTRISPELLLASIHDIESEKPNLSSAINPAIPGDVSSPSSIVTAALNAISANKGEQSDWKRFETLFLPEAKISVLLHKNDTSELQSFSINNFITMSKENNSTLGFKEYSTGNTIEEYNGLSTVFQSYVALHGEKQVKGINTYQLIYQKDRWWIASLIWTNNKNSVEVPSRYIKK